MAMAGMSSLSVPAALPELNKSSHGGAMIELTTVFLIQNLPWTTTPFWKIKPGPLSVLYLE